jgi:hypothetical protein
MIGLTVNPDMTLSFFLTSLAGQLLDKESTRCLEYHVTLKCGDSLVLVIRIVLVSTTSAKWGTCRNIGGVLVSSEV